MHIHTSTYCVCVCIYISICGMNECACLQCMYVCSMYACWVYTHPSLFTYGIHEYHGRHHHTFTTNNDNSHPHISCINRKEDNNSSPQIASCINRILQKDVWQHLAGNETATCFIMLLLYVSRIRSLYSYKYQLIPCNKRLKITLVTKK